MSTSNPPKPAHLPPIKLYNKIIKYYLPLSLSLSLSLIFVLPLCHSLNNHTTQSPPHHHHAHHATIAHQNPTGTKNPNPLNIPSKPIKIPSKSSTWFDAVALQYITGYTFRNPHKWKKPGRILPYRIL